MVGRWNTTRSNQNIAMHKWYREYYSAIHEVEVLDIHMEDGEVSVLFPHGGNPDRVPFPVLGTSVPFDNGEVVTRRASWGVYFPQKGDRLLLAFDVRGQPYTFGYSNYKFRELNRWDIAKESKGGIGWGKTSGKLLKPGDWSFKSARNSAFYLGDKASLTSGSMSLTLDNPNKEFKTKADLFIADYGVTSQSRLGSIKRFLVQGVDLQESYIQDATTGFPGQECTHYVKRPSIVIPAGILAVRSSIGDVIDDNTVIIPSPPKLFSPTLATSLTGTATRILRQVFDDATGKVPMWSEIIDNLGNQGIEAKTALGVGWSTPAATWTISNLATNWKSTATFDLDVKGAHSVKVGAVYSLDITGAANLESNAPMTLTAPQLLLGGSTAVSPLIMALTFGPSYTAFMNGTGTAFTALGAALLANPILLPLAAAFTTVGALATAAGGAFAGSQTTKTKAI